MFFSLISQELPISTRTPYSELYKEIRNYQKGDTTAFPYVEILIKKSKEEKNYKALQRAYKTAISFAPKNMDIFYADSCLWVAKENKDTILIGEGYLLKGAVLNKHRNYEKALNNYLKAEKYLHSTNDVYTQNILKYAIGQIKSYLRIYDEAYPMIESSNKYFSKLKTSNDSIFYLRTLLALKDINTQLGRFELATKMYHKGKGLKFSYDTKNMEALYDLYEGVNQYEQKNYDQAEFLITHALTVLKDKRNNSHRIFGYFYLGLINYDKGNIEKGISYFKMGDSLSQEQNYIRPRFRKVYENMIDYYKNSENIAQQLWAVNRLLDVDSKLNSQFKSISIKLNKEYDTQLLLREKERIEKSSLAESKTSIYSIIGLVFISLIFMAISIKIYIDKNNFEKLYKDLVEKRIAKKKIIDNANSKKQGVESKVVNLEKKNINIPKDLVHEVLEKLNQLENSKYFIENNVTSTKVAKKVKTNTTYLSNIINNEKGKTFTQYVNEIRINHLLELFETDTKISHYTIISLAKEVGFNNSKTFKSAFKEVTGMPLSFFLERFNQKNKSKKN